MKERGERSWARAGKKIVGGKRKVGGRNEGSRDVEGEKKSVDVEEEMEGWAGRKGRQLQREVNS